MMKKMYNEGDDEMKRTIAKVEFYIQGLETTVRSLNWPFPYIHDSLQLVALFSTLNYKLSYFKVPCSVYSLFILLFFSLIIHSFSCIFTN